MLIILKDATMLEFDNEKYTKSHLSACKTAFDLKKEFLSCNYPLHIIIDFINKDYYEEFSDMHIRRLKFTIITGRKPVTSVTGGMPSLCRKNKVI